LSSADTLKEKKKAMKHLLILLSLIIFPLSVQADFLVPEEAFQPSVALRDPSHIEATIRLGESIYLYKEKVTFSLENSDGIIIDKITMPMGSMHDNKTVFSGSPVIDIALAKEKALEGKQEISLKIAYQGCSGAGLCYEPMENVFRLVVDTDTLPLKEKKKTIKIKAPVKHLSETDVIAQSFIEGHVGLVLLTFFTFGLLLSLTPCVFPMIPILSSIIVSQGHNMNAKRGFLLSFVYVLAMSAAYTLAGVLAGLFGSNIQIAMQNPWVISTFALLFVGLAMSMFGFFEIGLPASWQSKLSKKSSEAESKGGLIGVAVMGFLSALIVGPCVAPPLAGALVYIGQTGDALLGGGALFVLSLGMGIPLLLLGTGTGKFMPRPGGWMQNVTKVFGVIMLGIAIWMLSRIIPAVVTMFLWGFLMIISGVYMGALEPLKRRSWDAFLKGVGAILFVYGFILLYGGLKGETDPFSPLPKEHAHNTFMGSSAEKLKFKIIHSSDELDELLAKSRGKKVMLDFYADWCASCKELKHTVFTDPHIIDALKEYVLIQADVTDNTPEEQALTKRFALYGPPAMIFFDENGQQIEGRELIGYKNIDAFLHHIHKIETE